ncbi:probable secreted glycoprotein (plasmid) [Halobacterium hubeiense]|uniref:Probable secreted glycoprotein n=1 Tax=Halobacterium hubeiense TaxID=1407499 RepID=A0A0U5H8K7_9EURY|nr:hypothetical protein [Halobacterium hubeiense]CQH63951.1 probable secreted glycoprotein [Halobacterium hubeiense]
MSDRRYRRTVLASLGTAAATALSGCSSASSDNTNSGRSATSASGSTPAQTNSGSSGVIETAETVTTQTTTTLGQEQTITALRVSVTDASVDAIALRNSDGKEVVRNRLGTSTTTDFPLTERAAGTYDILAIQDGSIVDERSKTFERTYTVDDVAFVTEEGTDSDKMGYTEVKTTITNTGNLPVTIPYYNVHGDGPKPARAGSRAPIGDSEDDTKPMVPPGESQTLTSQTSPLAAVDYYYSCGGEQKTGKITFETKSGQKTTINLEYSLSGEKIKVGVLNSCTESEIHSWNVAESE